MAEAGADLNAKDTVGITSLARAAALDNVDAITTLIKAGVDISSTHFHGGLALGGAVNRGLIRATSALLKAGIDVNSKVERECLFFTLQLLKKTWTWSKHC